MCVLLPNKYTSVLCSCISVEAKDEDGTPCGQSAEALPAFPSGLYHWDHLQLPGQGKIITLRVGCPYLLIMIYFVVVKFLDNYFCLQKVLPVSESDFVLKFLEVRFGFNTTM